MIKHIRLKSGTTVILREPKIEDLQELTRFANELSKEDTYVTLSGEVFTQEAEEEYIRRWLGEMQMGDRIHLFAFAKNEMIANAEVRRITKSRKRSRHVGEVAISVIKEWRGQGLGREILKNLIEEAKMTLKLRLLTLTVFGINKSAISLYESLGFAKAGEIPGAICYKGDYIAQVYMYLSLQ